MHRALDPEELFRRCDPRGIPFESTTDAPESTEILGQDRAVEAVEFAIGIQRPGYNLFALGPEGIGKQTLLRRLLERRAAQQSPTSDWCHVHNLTEPHRPRALRLPAGAGARLRAEMAHAVAELRVAMPAALDSEEYRSRKHQLNREFKRKQEDALEELQKRAMERRVAVVRTETGVVLAPLRGDEVLEAHEFEKLPEPERDQLKAAMEQVGTELTTMFRQFHDWARLRLEAVSALEHELAESVAHRVFDAARGALRDVPSVLDYLAEMERDVVENADRFTERSEDGLDEAVRRALHHDEDVDVRFRRYEVNVMIDHGGAPGAPIVYEDNPTHANLIGRIDHLSQLGALVTDFTLIRPGALHRANGGYLLLDALEVLRQPYAWDALKRALRGREVRIETLGQALGLVPTASLEPEPIPLEGLKVVLFGERSLYYLLATLDPDFDELFKVMADFEESVDRGRDSDPDFARVIAGLVRKESLRGFDRGAVARVIEHAARFAGDAQKLSVRFRPIVDLLREADYRAGAAGRTAVTPEDVQAAIDAQDRRAGRLRERMLEAIRRDTVLIDTGGAKIGQVNGLSVVALGEHAFGHPTRITARARVGKGEVVDIEREVELGGPIHSKGVLILGGLLGARYAQRMPLSLNATIVFEQSYGGVEGDSASLAELCALLSAIAEVPIDQSLAVTGSVNQHGEVQPIGGVNEKIEGFFDVCRERGLTGRQGVLIPKSNVQHLMLRKDVVAAVAERRFHIHAVGDVDDAVALLTGRAAASVNALVEARLAAFAEDARRFLGRPAER